MAPPECPAAGRQVPPAPSSPTARRATGARALARIAPLCRARSRHQQLPAADRPAAGLGLHRDRRLLADRPAGRGARDHRPAIRRGDRPHPGGAANLRGEAQAPQRLACALGGDRGVPPGLERCRVHRARLSRDRHRARHHHRRGRGAACRARLPCAARARRRPGPGLRYRRRLDRAGAGRFACSRAAHPRLAQRALGRRFADRGDSGGRR
jgi:hypothetical protein